MGNWKKIENENGFIYYVNEEKGIKQWDHPKFSDVKQGIDECNYVTYPSYRLALKFRVLQRGLFMEEVSLSTIISIFERHKLGNNENSLVLETCDLESVLSDIFFAANKRNHTNTDIDFASELVLNLLYNTFDCFREGNIQVFSTKILVGLLSNCTLLDYYKYLFSICSDHNYCITRVRLKALLMKMYDIIKYLHEDVSFGPQVVNSTVENCFQNSPGLVGITESSFVTWLESEPALLAWIPQIYKLKFAETIMHAVKCTTCKTKPLMGLKYSCVKCSRYIQCQRCFLTGRISHSHKLSHSVREYYGESVNNKEKSNDLIKIFCGLFCSNSSVAHSVVINPTSCVMKDIKLYQSSISMDIEPLSSPQTQLQSVIRQLESQNRELQQMLIFGNYNDKEIKKYLEEYRIFMAENIKKLKVLKNQINIVHKTKSTGKNSPIEIPNIQSTPIVQYNNNPKIMTLRNLSPITMITELEDNESQLGHDDIDRHSLSLQNANQNENNDFDIWNRENGQNAREPEVFTTVSAPRSPVKLLHNDLDEALAKLQQILANNFSLEDSLNPMDNCNLKYAVTEVEGMLTSIIDNVESSRSSSALPCKIRA
ncbi:dystrophin-like [Sitophilus oryzae]|uniref:Dystrophin-like n=1 Tax=Sitophilus oryzae TaxID=7048 RepID=A0A6J2YST8_SITOR|nr:dystrophin-like [Sitophilus oryzae]